MNVFKILKIHKNQLTKQQYKTLKGQARAGDTLGAIKGLNRLLKKQSKLSV